MIRTAILALAVSAGVGAGIVLDTPEPLPMPDRMLDLEHLGDNDIGNPNAFLEADGRLRVNCHAATVLCDDEEA